MERNEMIDRVNKLRDEEKRLEEQSRDVRAEAEKLEAQLYDGKCFRKQGDNSQSISVARVAGVDTDGNIKLFFIVQDYGTIILKTETTRFFRSAYYNWDEITMGVFNAKVDEVMAILAGKKGE